jgi:hypothetical protein
MSASRRCVSVLQNALCEALAGLPYAVKYAIHKRATKISPPTKVVCRNRGITQSVFQHTKKITAITKRPSATPKASRKAPLR